MQPNLANGTLQATSTLLIDRTTLWDNSTKDDDNNREKCVSPLTDSAWQSVSLLKDAIEAKYGLSPHQVTLVLVTVSLKFPLAT